MTIAVTFPGQGSQAIGMGKALADTYAEARLVFDEVDEALSQNLSDLIWNGEMEELTLTANAQPALMAVSIAAIKALESKGFNLASHASHVAGHSLGEYSALCAAGSLTVTDTAKLLRIRGNAMQEAVPSGEGAMAAIIGLERARVEEICSECSKDGVCQIANDNGGGQLVISGALNSVTSATARATEKGAKRAIMLPVSAPFHSALMASAGETMKEALSQSSVNMPVVPLVCNVLAQPISDPDEIKSRLVEQVTGKVRWAESVEWFAANGVTTLVEAGSGKVLTGLARRISRDLKGVPIGSPDDIEKSIETLLA